MLRKGDSALGVELCGSTPPKPKKVQSHHLVKTTFSKFTTCDHCGRILWGLIKQGLTCQTCGYVCHLDCSKDVAELDCTPQALDEESLEILLSLPKKNQDAKTFSSQGVLLGLDEKHSEAINHLINGEENSIPISKAVTENGILFNTSPTSPIPTRVYSREEPIKANESTSTEISAKNHNQTISTFRRHASLDLGSSKTEEMSVPGTSPILQSKLFLNNFVRDFMKTREQHERELERARNNPSLNFMTTFMQNLTQFVPRVTGVRILRDNIVKIFTWENPKHSWGIFFIYVLICLRPVWLVIIPFIVLWVQQIQEYLKEIYETDSVANSPNERGAQGEKGLPEPQSPFSYYSTLTGNDFMAARETASKYALNMQFLQNLMGTHVQVYDQNEKNWKEFIETHGPHWPLWLTVKYLPSLLIMYYAFSAQSLFLIFGFYVFLGNNPFVRALVVNFSSLLVDELNSHFNLSSLALKVRAITLSKFSSKPRAITISVFENQRWWAMLGWNDQTISTERCSWTDETGKLEQIPIFQQHPEPGYVWEECSSWEVVRNWCLPIMTDECGWVYYNNIWLGPSSKPQINSFTRRRLWTRKMVSE